MVRATASPNDKRILNYMNRVGYQTPLYLQVRFNIQRDTLQDILSRLYLQRLIDRPVKGLVVSLKWASENPEEIERINNLLGCHIA